MEIFLEGFFLQASIILALGTQNVYVLNAGLYRQRHILVALLSSVCDLFLILVGVLGVATVFVQIPLLKIIFGILGVSFLGYYALLKLKEASSSSFSENAQFVRQDLKQTILTTLAFSLLNPHVILDTLVLIGGYSTKFPEALERLSFGLGAIAFSFVWFFSLALLAASASRLVHNPKAMRMISALSGLVLLGLALRLGWDVWGWILAV